MTPEEKQELRELVREAVRAELASPKVDAPKPPVVRRKPPPEAYEFVRRLRRRKGIPE